MEDKNCKNNYIEQINSRDIIPVYTFAAIKKYIETLDIYLVSHDGVGSEYLRKILKNNGLKVEVNKYLTNQTAHCSQQFTTRTPTIVIYGDYYNAINSMYRRDCLVTNANKIILHNDCNHQPLSYFKKHHPQDPIGLKLFTNN